MSEPYDKFQRGRALENLVTGIDQDLSQPASEIPHAIRRRLQALLDSPELYLDCAQLLVSQVIEDPSTQVLFLDPRSRYTLQVFCWPPGFGNQPHLHKNWTVSAVMAGSLLVFRSSISGADCLASKPLLATAGQAGVLVPPQFHCLRNDGDETAITFHVFSADQVHTDGIHLERDPTSLSVVDDDGLLAIATVAARYRDPRSIDIARSAFSAVGNSTKLQLVKLMLQLDPAAAVCMGRELSQLVGGSDGPRLLALIEKLEVSIRSSVL